MVFWTGKEIFQKVRTGLDQIVFGLGKESGTEGQNQGKKQEGFFHQGKCRLGFQ